MSSAATDKTTLGYKLWLKFFGDKANRKNIQNALSVEPPSDTDLTTLLGVDSQGHTIIRKKLSADTIANQSLYEAQSSVALSYQDSEGASHTVLFADSSGIVDPFIFKGVIDCALNPNYPAADAGHVYKVSVAGKIGGSSGKTVEAGDTVYCVTDSSATGNEATVGANWVVIQQGDKSYSTDGTLATNSDGLIPTEKAVKTYVDGRFSPMVIPEKTPVNAVAASGVLTSDNTDVADGATVTIGEIVYRFKDTMAQAYDVKRTGTADDTLANLVHAINGTGSAGVNYYEGTVAHTLVTSGDVSSHAITVTAKTKGVAGDSIAKAEDSDHLDWDGTGEYFTGGVDGTVGVANELCADATYLYHCIATNTIADDNWRQIALGSAY